MFFLAVTCEAAKQRSSEAILLALQEASIAILLAMQEAEKDFSNSRNSLNG